MSEQHNGIPNCASLVWIGNLSK